MFNWVTGKKKKWQQLRDLLAITKNNITKEKMTRKNMTKKTAEETLKENLLNAVFKKHDFNGDHSTATKNAKKVLARLLTTKHGHVTDALNGDILFSSSELEKLQKEYDFEVPENYFWEEPAAPSPQVEAPAENPVQEADCSVQRIGKDKEEDKEEARETPETPSLRDLVLKTTETSTEEYPSFFSKKFTVTKTDGVEADFEVFRHRDGKTKHFSAFSEEERREYLLIRELKSKHYSEKFGSFYFLAIEDGKNPYTEVYAASKIHIPNQLLEKAQEVE